jgi:transposase-like protein
MRQWAPELRAEAVRELRAGHEAITTASRRLGVPPSTLRRWLREDATRRTDWIPPITPNDPGAAPRMLKVLAAFASPTPHRQRRSLVVTLLLSAAWVALCCGVALDVVSDDVISGAWPRGLAAVVLGAAAGGVAALLSSRRSLHGSPSSAGTPLPLPGRSQAALTCATVEIPAHRVSGIRVLPVHDERLDDEAEALRRTMRTARATSAVASSSRPPGSN